MAPRPTIVPRRALAVTQSRWEETLVSDETETETDEPGQTTSDEEAQRTHEGNAHADFVETDGITPGQGGSEPPAEGEKLPNQS